MDFRAEASNKMRSSSVLDQPVRLTGPRSWIAIGALAGAFVLAILWSLLGTLPRQLNAVGILMPEHGFFTVQSVLAGQVVRLDVKPGTVIRAGTTVAVVSDGREWTAVRATGAGRVASVRARVGQVISSGDPIAIAENSPVPSSGLVAVLYVPSSVSSDIQAGSRVDLDVDGAPAGRYGMLRGTVQSIAKATESSAEISEFVGDEKAGRALASGGGARKVVVLLGQADRNLSGYQWSSASGPPFKLGARTHVAALIEQQPMRPIQWVFG